MTQRNERYTMRLLSPADKNKIALFCKMLSCEDRIFFSFLGKVSFEDLLNSTRFYTVICSEGDDGYIKGYGHIERFSDPCKRHVGKLGIAVHPEERGTGLSRQIMEALLASGREKGLSKIWLSVHRANKKAIRLYEGYGFKPEGVFFREEIWEGRIYDVVSMALQLGPVSDEPPPVPWGQPAINTDEFAEVLKVLQSGWLSQGPTTALFESRIAQHIGAENVVVMNNGTSCLQAIFYTSFKPGEKVIFPAFTFVSTLNAALAAGIEPILADIDNSTGNIDLDMTEDMLKSDPSIAGFVGVDIAGHPLDAKRCQEVSSRYGVRFIEDAAEGIGSACYNKMVGSFGHPTMFSFHAAKIITTVEGGAIATNDAAYARALRKFRSHGENLDKKFLWDTFGLNFRITDLQAAIGLAQIERIDSFIHRRNQIAEFYRTNLAGYVEFQVTASYVNVHSYMLFVILVPYDMRSRIVESMHRNRVFFREGWLPLHCQPVFAPRFIGLSLKVAEDWGKRALCLPMFNTMTINEAERVVKSIRDAFH